MDIQSKKLTEGGNADPRRYDGFAVQCPNVDIQLSMKVKVTILKKTPAVSFFSLYLDLMGIIGTISKNNVLNYKVFLPIVPPYFHQETNGETQLRTKSLEIACRANRSEQMKMVAPPYDNGHGDHNSQEDITKKHIECIHYLFQ